VIRAYFAERKAVADAREHQRGYDYAAGALLRGTAPNELEIEMDAMQYRTQFDVGMERAIHDWNTRWNHP